MLITLSLSYLEPSESLPFEMFLSSLTVWANIPLSRKVLFYIHIGIERGHGKFPTRIWEVWRSPGSFPPNVGLRPNWRQYSGFKLHPTASTLNTRLHCPNSTRQLSACVAATRCIPASTNKNPAWPRATLREKLRGCGHPGHRSPFPSPYPWITLGGEYGHRSRYLSLFH